MQFSLTKIKSINNTETPPPSVPGTHRLLAKKTNIFFSLRPYQYSLKLRKKLNV